MSRQIRRVPKDWEHPVNDHGFYIPMEDRTLVQGMLNWIRYDVGWYLRHPQDLGEWIEKCPLKWRSIYRPRFTTPAICYQIYEEVSEGTPVSPVFETIAELRQWLLDQGHTEKATDAFIEHEWAPSALVHITTKGEVQWSANIDSWNLD